VYDLHGWDKAELNSDAAWDRSEPLAGSRLASDRLAEQEQPDMAA
jgi:hypothetical protein